MTNPHMYLLLCNCWSKAQFPLQRASESPLLPSRDVLFGYAVIEWKEDRMSKRDLDCETVKEECFSTGERRDKDKSRADVAGF